MKAIDLYTLPTPGSEHKVGRLWVRPAGGKGTTVADTGGLIEMQLDSLPVTGRLYAKDLVDCHLFEAKERRVTFETAQEGHAFIAGLRAFGLQVVFSGPTLEGEAYDVSNQRGTTWVVRYRRATE